MASSGFGDEGRNGSVKTAISIYAGRNLRSSSDANKHPHVPQEFQNQASSALHKYRREISFYQERRKAAESEKAKANSQLSNAKKTVQELTLPIDKLSSKAKTQKRDIEMLKVEKDNIVMARNNDHSEYADLSRDLEFVKQDLTKLKLNTSSVSQDKQRANHIMEESHLKMESNLRSVDSLGMEIEMVNDEQVLVELARIEALKEFGEIEAERGKKSREFLVAFDERNKKIKELMEEVEKMNEMEDKLSFTLSDIDMLETQLKLVKEMEKRVQRVESMGRRKIKFERDEDNLSVLKQITEVLEAKKMELSFIKAEGFQFMTSMDAIRKELIRIKEETARLNKLGDKADLKIQSLNSKLLGAKSKLEAVAAGEEQANLVAANLSATLDQLKTEIEAAKQEKLLVEKETDAARAESRKTEIETDEKERSLLSKLHELEEVKCSEALVLEKLESLIETAIEARASDLQQGSTITISRFEYKYLTGRAIQANETADKKVAAADAWVEALKASERQVQMKTKMLKKENRKSWVEEEETGDFRTQISVSWKKEKEIQKWRQKQLSSREIEDFPGRPKRQSSIRNANGKLGQTPRPKYRKSFTLAARASPTYFVIKKRGKVPNLVKYLSGKK